ncbi:uncharacterized protein LOC125446599 isoform X2 [Stegostoma tigrinum]|uniref:uncharacterized protein LOC125446599 isoform X2 n=1 Tax=Stegostoma tigrinum TaxID=3053191 RepID=UPI00202B929F|nr:uncharacterized protein LOC125446599 isoform X2 [Stegostoma tigrinum]
MDPRPLLVLLLGLLRGIAAGGGNVVAAIGSSVLLDPEYGANLSDSQVEWTFKNSSGKLLTILDYIPNSPVQKPNKHYHSRLRFNASNGSIMVDSLKPSDQGVYTITVNGTWNRSMDLKLIEPLAEPLIKATFVDSAVELTCHMTAGKASSILWRKGPDLIRNGQHYQLVQNNSKLIIVKATKADCDTYTCTVENMFSKRSDAYHLILHSTQLLHDCARILSIIALAAAAAALICEIIAFFLKVKTEFPGLHLLQNLLQILQFLLLSGAFGCWIYAEGPTETTVIILMLLVLLLVGVVPSTWSVKVCDTKMLSKIWIVKPYRLIRMVAESPLGGIVVISLSCSLIVATVRRAGKGCVPSADRKSSLILAGEVLLPLLPICFIFYIIYCNRKMWATGNQTTSNTELNEPFLKTTAADMRLT